MSSIRIVAFVILAGLASAGPLRAQGRLTVDEENDKFGSRDDRHYTQGLRFSYLTHAITAGASNAPFAWLAENLHLLADVDPEHRTRKIEWTIPGQSIFTPKDVQRTHPDPHDRPYAAWLYTGAALLQESWSAPGGVRTLENLELLVGVVGPAAFGREAQNDFHQYIGVQTAKGWRRQLHNEPGMMLSYERKWSFERSLGGGFGVDVIPEAGVTVGNVLTSGQLGALARFGRHLSVDYGPSHIRPSVSGTAWFDEQRIPAGDLGGYLFVGTQGRVVGRNVFLDGNAFRSSPSVDKKPTVADFVGGASLFWGRGVKLDFTVTQRTSEFYGQRGQDRFGMITLSVGL